MKKLILFFTFFLGFILIANSQGFELQQINTIPVIVKNDTLKNAWAGGINSSTISTCDFDQDGTNDILLFDRDNNRNLVFLIESGMPLFTLNYQSKLPNLSRYGIFYDFDKDGKKDLFTSVINGIKVFKNTSVFPDLSFNVFKEPMLTNYFGDFVNMDVSILDVPAFVDVDNDGDMDILHFRSSQGTSIDLERNISTETYSKPDSLLFKNLDNCWGGLMEQNCNAYNFGFACKNNFRLEHSGGGAILAFDSDNDLDKDLILGKEDCNNFNFLQNNGTIVKPVFTKSSSTYPAINSPSISYPLPFNEDVNGDNLKDLIVTMGNANDTSDFKNSIWFYKNTGSNDVPNFTYQSNNFLQNTMIDLGRNTVPLLIDLDGDSDLDLLISNSASKGKPATIYKFLNSGNLTNPVYSLSDSNFLQQQTRNLDDISITVSDLNNDKNQDLIVSSEKNGSFQIDWFINSSTSGFTSSETKQLDTKSSSPSNLLFIDIDGNGLNDLLMGSKNGDLKYFSNVGTANLPGFKLIDSTYGGIKSNNSSTNGNLNLAIADIDNDSNEDLITVNDSGFVYCYPSFKNQNPKYFTNKNIIKVNTDNTSLGKRLSLVIAELNGDNISEVIMGNQNGGLFLFQLSAITTSFRYENQNNEIYKTKIFPNPSLRSITVENQKNITLTIIDYSGLEVFKNEIFNKKEYTLDILKPGIYLVITETEDQKRQCQKLAIK